MAAAPTSIPSRPERHGTRWVLLAIAALLLGGLAVALLYHFDVVGGSSGSTAEGSGIAATQARTLPAFHGIELAGGNNVVVHVGEKQSVVVEADDNLLDRVTTRVRSGELVVANAPGSLAAKSPMSVVVAMPTLGALTLSGSGNIVVDGVEASSLEVTLPGSGTLTATGTAKRLDVRIDGSGTVRFSGLVADDVRAAVNGSGSIFVTATQSLDASVSGSGAIVYTGNPHAVTRTVTGTGAIAGS